MGRGGQIIFGEGVPWRPGTKDLQRLRSLVVRVIDAYDLWWFILIYTSLLELQGFQSVVLNFMIKILFLTSTSVLVTTF
jgi:hypothetical protein